jgi:hypothetical protein
MTNPVPAEFLDLAHALRRRIAADEERYLEACDAIIRPLRPRPAWPSPTRRSYLKRVAQAYALIDSLCRVRAIARVSPSGIFQIWELRVATSTLTFPAWGAAAEPSLELTFYDVSCPPFVERSVVVGQIGIHALGRRFQRGFDNTENGVLDDLSGFVGAFAKAMRNSAKEFEIAAADGVWRAMLSGDGETLAARTYV